MNYTNIGWTDFTWNPVTGCYHGCEYCYAKRIAHRFRNQDEESEKTAEWAKENNMVLETKSKKDPYPLEFVPTFHKNRLDQPCSRKKPAKIFVSSMGDLFGDWVPREWIEQVIEVAENCPRHIFQFLTKNPAKYYNFDFPDNCWLGASADNANDAHCRSEILSTLDSDNIKFLSLEPLFEDVAEYIDYSGMDWIIVGAQTGPGAKETNAYWVQKVIDFSKENQVSVFLKDSLNWSDFTQEWPEGVVN